MSRAPEGDSPAHETLNGKGRGTDNGNGLGNGNGHGRVHDDGDQREASITTVALESGHPGGIHQRHSGKDPG